MKRSIIVILCVIMLISGALAEDSATVIVDGVGEHVTVTLTMDDDRIISVDATSDNTEADDRGKESLALITSAMVEKNTLAVDTISGATCTSNAVIAGATEAWLQIMRERMSREEWMQKGSHRDPQSLIEEMVVDYGAYGSKADEQVETLLGELKEIAPATSANWEQIMRLWKSTQTDLSIHPSILPDGLDDTDALCLVVLGFQLNPDGTMREELIERLRVALDCAEKYPDAFIVCTGGGTAAEDPTATEAGRMAEWLIENGIAEHRVIVEDRSLTTVQNAIYTFDILTERYPQVRQLAIISSDYHIATGTLLFGAEAILRGAPISVVSNAAWPAPSGTLSAMFQAGALIELSGDVETAFEIYYDTYDIHELPDRKSTEQSQLPASNTEESAAEKLEQLYTLNRAGVSNLDIEDGPVYVIGHRSPDSDTVCSAIAYARLLNLLGYPAEAAANGPVNTETTYILREAGVEAPPILEDASGKSIFLVDHSEYAQSTEGMTDAHIVGILDHHGVGTVSTGYQLLYEAKPIGATATIVWLDYLNYGLEIDRATATLLLGAVLSDTTNLTGTTVTEADRQAVPDLARRAGIDDVKAFYLELHSALLSYEGMSDEEILFSDYKEYEVSGVKFGIGAVSVIDEDTAKAMAERMSAILPQGHKEVDVDLLFASVGIREEDQKIDYIVPADEQSRTYFVAAFPNPDEYNGTAYIFRNGGLGRKSKFVPGLTDYLNSHPHE